MFAYLEVTQLWESLAAGWLFANKWLDSSMCTSVDFQVSFLVEALVAAWNAAVVSLPRLVSTFGGMRCCRCWSHLWGWRSRLLLLGLYGFHQAIDVGGEWHACERAVGLTILEFVWVGLAVGLVRVYWRLRFSFHGRATIERRQGISRFSDLRYGGWQLGRRAGISWRGLHSGGIADVVVLLNGILVHAREIESVCSRAERNHARSGSGRKHVHGEFDVIRLLERPGGGWGGGRRYHRGYAHWRHLHKLTGPARPHGSVLWGNHCGHDWRGVRYEVRVREETTQGPQRREMLTL